MDLFQELDTIVRDAHLVRVSFRDCIIYILRYT